MRHCVIRLAQLNKRLAPTTRVEKMKKINGIWHVCRDGWVFEVATESEVTAHLFSGISQNTFENLLA